MKGVITFRTFRKQGTSYTVARRIKMCRTKKLPDEETTRFTSRPKRFTRHLLQLYTTGIRCVKNHNIYRVPVLVLLWYSVPGV